jgi:hypothetical protein
MRTAKSEFYYSGAVTQPSRTIIRWRSMMLRGNRYKVGPKDGDFSDSKTGMHPA